MKRLLIGTFAFAAAASCAWAQEKSNDFFKPEPAGKSRSAVDWQNANSAQLAEATKRETLVKFVQSPAAAEALLAQVKGAYATPSAIASQVAAISQMVMNQKCEKAPACRKIWSEALLKAAQESTDAYRTVFFLDQLRWCGTPCQAAAIDAIGAKAAKIVDAQKSVMEMSDLVAGELDHYPDTPDDEGFVWIFNGKDLTGWTGSQAYVVKTPGILECDPKGKGGGNLLTVKEYKDFVLRFEFMMPVNGNNGVGIRTPSPNIDSAYHGMCELQLLDDGGSQYYDAKAKKDKLKPYQYTGSVYGIVPSLRDNVGKQVWGKDKNFTGGGSYVRKPGMWNFEEIHVVGSKIKVYLNGYLITDADVSKFKGDGDTMDHGRHPGLHREKGHIGFLGHGHNVKWKNIRVKEITDGKDVVAAPPRAPRGYTALFNGKDLANWKGVTTKDGFDNPIVRQSADAKKAAEMQKLADNGMREHWHVRNGVLFFDGFNGGYSLATVKDYRNFDMYVDWRLMSITGDSGLYLRGSPQVQIWDAHNQWHIGSGGLYNNQKNPSRALCIADNQIGEWNRFRIKMVNDRVSVWLNGKLVVDNVVLENYWNRNIPIFPCEQIELQCHGDPLEFKNIYIRELP